MANDLKDGEAAFQPYHEEFTALVKAIEKLTWSKDWNFKASMYGKPKIRGASIRMWKKTWPDALHFESWIGNADIERGSASLAFHIETSLAPFGVKRNAFNQALIDGGAGLMDGWEGFSLHPKSYQTVKRHVPVEAGGVAMALKPEVARLQQLGNLIDQLLGL